MTKPAKRQATAAFFLALVLLIAWVCAGKRGAPPSPATRAPEEAAAALPCSSCPETPLYTAAMCRADLEGFTDRFAGKNPRWNWMETVGGGRHRLVSVNGANAVEIGISPGGGPDESDSSFEERGLIRRWGSFHFSLRCADPNTGHGAGTMGWGVWKPGGARDLDAIWFLSCSNLSDEKFRGFFAMVIKGGKILFSKKLLTDVTARHDYFINITPEKAVFLIDGKKEAQSGPLPSNLSCMKTVCWIDNKVLREVNGIIRITHERTTAPKTLILFEAGSKKASE